MGKFENFITQITKAKFEDKNKYFPFTYKQLGNNIFFRNKKKFVIFLFIH